MSGHDRLITYVVLIIIGLVMGVALDFPWPTAQPTLSADEAGRAREAEYMRRLGWCLATGGRDILLDGDEVTSLSDPPPVADSTVSIPWLPWTVAAYSDTMTIAGRTYGVDPDLVAIITLVESGGDPTARSGAGAAGLMQVMPGTASDIARWRGIPGFDATTLTSPLVSIDFGTWYIARQLAAFGVLDDDDWARSVSLAAIAYNGGPGSAATYVARGVAPAESLRYEGYVSEMWAERRDETSPGFERWRAAGGDRLLQQAAEFHLLNGAEKYAAEGS